jgi:hypothetical protein
MSMLRLCRQYTSRLQAIVVILQDKGDIGGELAIYIWLGAMWTTDNYISQLR